tara:strand:- start:351 stop:980 length:630 start_codon:yes stop_codon:yes gene_type:complete
MKGNKMNVTNTINLTQIFEVGQVLFMESDKNFSFEVVSAYNVTPLFGVEGRKVRLAKAVKEAIEVGKDYTPNNFNPAEEVVNENNLNILEVAKSKGVKIGNPKVQIRKAGMGPVGLTQETVYSHLKSADDVVRSDIPQAVGYNPLDSKMWNDYLDGGDGALRNRNLTDNLFLKGFVSDCCQSFPYTVAGFVLCGNCKGEFVTSVLEETS